MSSKTLIQPQPIPRLEAERLVLRAFDKSDFDAHLAIMSRPEVNRFLGPPMTREGLWRRTVASVGMWTVLGFGGWIVERKADGKLIGNVGFFDARRDLEPDFRGAPEMGWIFDPEVHGHGLAGEACRTALDWLDRNLQPTPVWAIISPDNAPSRRLASRLGFVEVSETVYESEATLVLQRPERD